MKFKAGYEGKDSMREKAAKMMGMVEKTSLKSKASKSAVDAEKPRPYKTGGSVQKSPPYDKPGKSVGVSKGPNAEMSRASRDKAPMRGEPSPGMKTGGGVKKKVVVKRAAGGTVGGDVNGSGDKMSPGAMNQWPGPSTEKPVKLAMGGVGKIRHGAATKSGAATKPKRKGYEY